MILVTLIPIASRQIIYDLDQLPSEHRLPLRDTLLAALSNIGPGERGILTQLCLALADLLLQLPEWTNALQGLIDQLGSRPDTVPALLHFLEVLPEELGNTRIRVTVSEVERIWNRIRADCRLFGLKNNDWRTENTGAQVIQLISMYFQAPGMPQSQFKRMPN
jgi:transportin-3